MKSFYDIELFIFSHNNYGDVLFKVKFIVNDQSKQFYFVFNWEGELIVRVSQNCGLVFADVCNHAIVVVPMICDIHFMCYTSVEFSWVHIRIV